MLVLSRERGTSVIVNGPQGGCLVTVLGIRGAEVTVVVSHPSAEPANGFDAWTAKLSPDSSFKIGPIAEVRLIDVRGETAHLGVLASDQFAVHRLEVWEAMQPPKRRGDGGADSGEGPAGSPVTPPDQPTPPSLNCRLPPPTEDNE